MTEKQTWMNDARQLGEAIIKEAERQECLIEHHSNMRKKIRKILEDMN